jgi:uncharacterized protein
MQSSKRDQTTELHNEPDENALYQAYTLFSTAPEQALDVLKSLAERGSVMSMLYVGEAYRFGKGIDIDLVQSQRWFERAASCGSLLGAYEFGRLLYEQKRYNEAIAAFEIGARQSYGPSLNMLARMYLNGQGVSTDINRGRELLEDATAIGNVFAKRSLAGLLLRGTFGPLAFLRGIRLFFGALKDILVVAPGNPSSDRLR